MEEQRDENLEELAKKLETRISEKEEGSVREEPEDKKYRTKWGNFLTDENSEDDWEEEEADEEGGLLKPWMMAAVFAGLVALAAIICAVLWHFTHQEREESDISSQPSGPVIIEENTSGSTVTPESASTGVSESAFEVMESVAEPVSTPAAAPEAAVTPEAVATPETAVMPEAMATPAVSPAAAVQEPVSGTAAMEFAQSDDSVTPKDVINLRSEPSTLDSDNIVAQAKKGEILNRTGVNDTTGWTRVEYNGQTVYAVSQYLTTDLEYKTPVQTADPNRVNTIDGRIILFTDCSDNITPKEYVNLRTEPSTSEGDSTVRCQISNGEVLHRTGYSPDAGWSRVEYNGETLYVVSSYVYTVE